MALQDKLIDALGRFATTFNSYRYIMAIKSAFITLMPVIIVGAFSVLISNMVLDPKNGLASFSSLSFLAALKPITSALNYATLNFLNIGAVFLIGIELGRINGIKSLFPGLLAVIAFAVQQSLLPAFGLLLLLGVFGGFFIVPLNALLQERGKHSVGAGNAIAVQNLGENVAMLLMLGLYSLAVSVGVPPVAVGIGFGAVFAVAIAALWVWGRRK